RTSDLYFVADGTGGHAFAATLEEHNRNVARWRQIQATQKQTQDAVPAASDASTAPATAAPAPAEAPAQPDAAGDAAAPAAGDPNAADAVPPADAGSGD